MKHPNGYGSVSKLSGKRRRPYMVMITTGFSVDPVLGTAKQHRQVLGYYSNRKDALQALADYNKDPYSLDTARVTFAELYDIVKKDFTAGRARNYSSAYRYLAPVADLPVRSIRAAQMQACIDACATTQQREIKTVCRKVYEYAVAQDIVDKNPALYLHCNAPDTELERDIFTPDQIEDLYAHRGLWWCQVTLILLYTGMRTKELRDLMPEDIDLEDRLIYIRQGKNKSSIRQIPIHDDILPIVTTWRENMRSFTHNGYNKMLKKKYGRLAHDCRHTFTTRLRECGCDLLILQLLLGHTPQTITERVYTHISVDELRSAVALLDFGVCLLP